MTKNQTIDLLKNQLPGFYSVEQVINLIEKIEEEKTTTISSERIDTITRSIVELIDEEQMKIAEGYEIPNHLTQLLEQTQRTMDQNHA